MRFSLIPRPVVFGLVLAMLASSVYAPSAHAQQGDSVFHEHGPIASIAISDSARPFATLSHSALSLRDSLVLLARAQIGTRYKFGGTTPQHGFDCSGLVRYVMAALNIALPRTAHEQAKVGLAVLRDSTQLRPGDVVTFGSNRHISHVGIYVGDGRVVQASSKAGHVIETPLIRPYKGVKPWRGARRLLPDDSAATSSNND